MELKQIKELMATMGRTGTKKLSLKKEGFEIELEREENGSFRQGDASLATYDFAEESSYRVPSSDRANAALLKGTERSAPLAGSVAAEESREAALYITSPMVGTFYAAGTPEDPSFVKVGDKVDKHSVVCIIEAMKVMNEVKAGIAGTIMEVLVENGHPVEFGTKLFRIS